MLVLVNGGSCSGKSTFSERLKQMLVESGVSCDCLSTDLFYKEIPQNCNLYDYNFDTPAAFDNELFFETVNLIQCGKAFQLECFDFKTHSRSKIMSMQNCRVLIVEGIFSFVDKKLVNSCALNIFIDTDLQTRYKRRYKIYSQIMKHDDSFINHKFYNQAEPYFESDIYPLRRDSHLVINGDKSFDVPLKCITAYLRSIL